MHSYPCVATAGDTDGYGPRRQKANQQMNGKHQQYLSTIPNTLASANYQTLGHHYISSQRLATRAEPAQKKRNNFTGSAVDTQEKTRLERAVKLATKALLSHTFAKEHNC